MVRDERDHQPGAAPAAAVPDGHRVTGLFDRPEGAYVHATLARLGRTEPFFACDRDLEDELIRALGPARVLAVIDAAGDRGSWQTLQHQPFHRDRPDTEVLRRFMGTTSGGSSGMPGCSQRRWHPMRCQRRWWPCWTRRPDGPHVTASA